MRALLKRGSRQFFSFHIHRGLRAVTTPPGYKLLTTEASSFSQSCLIEGEEAGPGQTQLKASPSATERGRNSSAGAWLSSWPMAQP